MTDILIALAVKNNEDVLKDKLDSILDCPYTHMIPLIIDDGSFDESVSIIADNDVHFVMHEEPLGYGGVLTSAIAYARDYSLEYCFVLPLEAFTDWRSINNVLLYFNEFDIITGSRILAIGAHNNFLYNEIISYFNQQTGLHIIDPLSPIKGISMKHSDLFEITEFSDAALLQLLIQGAHFKMSIKEFEWQYKDHVHSIDIEQIISNIDSLKYFIQSEVYLYPFTKQGH